MADKSASNGHGNSFSNGPKREHEWFCPCSLVSAGPQVSGRIYRPRTVHLAPEGERGPMYSYRGLACPKPCCAVVVQGLSDEGRVAAMRRHLDIVHSDAPGAIGESTPGHQQ